MVKRGNNLVNNRKSRWAMDNYKCSQCGSTSDLQVHHKDCIPRNVSNNHSVSNLITLCRSCHRQLHSKKLERNRYIKTLRSDGLSYRQIARMMGLKDETVWEICQKQWGEF